MDYNDIFPEWAVDWAEKRLKNNDVKRSDILLVRDWLNAYSKENPKLKTKIMKLKWEDAMIAQEKWHKSLLEKTEKLKKYDGDINDFDKIDILKHRGIWGKIKTKEGLKFEGSVMGHCIGSGGYDDSLESGQIEIYSLRDKNGLPHVTVEYDIEQKTIYQIKGRGNSYIPDKYVQDVSELIKFLDPEYVEDIGLAGMVFGILNGEKKIYSWNDIENWPKGFHIPFLGFGLFQRKRLPENCKIDTLLVVNMCNFNFPDTLNIHSLLCTDCINFTIKDNVKNLSLLNCKEVELPEIIQNIEDINMATCSIKNIPEQISVENININAVKMSQTNEDVSFKLIDLATQKLHHKI